MIIIQIIASILVVLFLGILVLILFSEPERPDRDE
jgi:hypothetical protein